MCVHPDDSRLALELGPEGGEASNDEGTFSAETEHQLGRVGSLEKRLFDSFGSFYEGFEIVKIVWSLVG